MLVAKKVSQFSTRKIFAILSIIGISMLTLVGVQSAIAAGSGKSPTGTNVGFPISWDRVSAANRGATFLESDGKSLNNCGGPLKSITQTCNFLFSYEINGAVSDSVSTASAYTTWAAITPSNEANSLCDGGGGSGNPLTLYNCFNSNSYGQWFKPLTSGKLSKFSLPLACLNQDGSKTISGMYLNLYSINVESKASSPISNYTITDNKITATTGAPHNLAVNDTARANVSGGQTMIKVTEIVSPTQFKADLLVTVANGTGTSGGVTPEDTLNANPIGSQQVPFADCATSWSAKAFSASDFKTYNFDFGISGGATVSSSTYYAVLLSGTGVPGVQPVGGSGTSAVTPTASPSPTPSASIPSVSFDGTAFYDGQTAKYTVKVASGGYAFYYCQYINDVVQPGCQGLVDTTGTGNISASTTIKMIFGAASGSSFGVKVFKSSDINANQPRSTAVALASGSALFYYASAKPGNFTTAPTATAGNSQATVTWTAPTTGGKANKYVVTSSPAGGSCTVQTEVGKEDAPTTCTITGLTNGTSYTFSVVASNSMGSSTASGASNSITPGSASGEAPTGLVATPGNAVANISFTAGATNGATITNYKYSLDGVTYVALNPADATSPITIPGLTNGTAYTIYLKAVTSSGDSAASSPVSVTPSDVPGAPTIGVATKTGTSTATVAFTAPTSTGGSAITSYTVTSSPGNITATGTSSPITITGLTSGTSYTFTVAAKNVSGVSLPSGPSNTITTDIGSGTPSPTPTPTPNTSNQPVAGPSGLTVKAGNGSASISFVPGSSNGATISNYKYSLDGVTYTALDPADATSPITIPGLTNGTAYTIYVKAVTSAGDSAPSAAVKVTPVGGSDKTSGKNFKRTISIFFAPNSFSLDAKSKSALKKAFELVEAKSSSNSDVTVEVTGWVQPTSNSANDRELSRSRATATANYLKETLGLEASYSIKASGRYRVNAPEARRATLEITITNPKS